MSITKAFMNMVCLYTKMLK